jgi:exo-1,4-beta-D-glucosaminidase
LHALYTYDDGTVSVDNLSGLTQSGLSVEAKVCSIDGRLLDDQTADGISVAAQGVARELLHPVVPAPTTPPTPAQTYFVELLLSRGGQVIDRNVYWLSTQQDIVEWSDTIGNPQATMTQYADLTQLQSLPTATVSVTARTHSIRSWENSDGPDTETDVTITNTSSTPTVAFFLRADVRRGSVSGVPAPGHNEVLPIMWSDDDITLWPAESETMRATYRRSELDGTGPVVSVFGRNVQTQDVPAGA